MQNNSMYKYFKTSNRSESALEKATLSVLRKRGALCFKFTSSNKKGVPDDIVLLKNGKAVFVEFKNPNGVHVGLSTSQLLVIRDIKSNGFDVFVVVNNSQADYFIDWCIENGGLDAEL